MINRRSFLRTVPALGAGTLLTTTAFARAGSNKKPEAISHRAYWIDLIDKISRPVLDAGSAKRLKADMPVETPNGKTEKKSTYLEAVGRLLAGIAPWLESEGGNAAEEKLRSDYRTKARQTIASIADPTSPDYLFDYMEGQMLVDSAFLAHAFLRAPKQLWEPLSESVKQDIVRCFVATRTVKPPYNNWLLFAAMVEAFFLKNNLPYDVIRLDFAMKKHQEWYLGDGMYGDGANFHWDYYNSYVIQPMLMDIADVMAEKKLFDVKETEKIATRFARYAAIQEQLISPEGSFPAIGRSITYRMGAFQHLSQAALQGRLPEQLKPAQVRCALTAVMQRLMSAPGTFDQKGWLQLGLCGHQPALAEYYISTGSLYLCSVGLLALGLPETHEFWSGEDSSWSSVRVWNGENQKADHAIYV